MASRLRSKRKIWSKAARSRRHCRRIGLLAGGGLLVAAAWLFGDLVKRSGHSRIDPGDVAQVEHGRAIYSGACASCHGPVLASHHALGNHLEDGRSLAPPLDAAGLFALAKRPPMAYAADTWRSARGRRKTDRSADCSCLGIRRERMAGRTPGQTCGAQSCLLDQRRALTLVGGRGSTRISQRL